MSNPDLDALYPVTMRLCRKPLANGQRCNREFRAATEQDVVDHFRQYHPKSRSLITCALGNCDFRGVSLLEHLQTSHPSATVAKYIAHAIPAKFMADNASDADCMVDQELCRRGESDAPDSCLLQSFGTPPARNASDNSRNANEALRETTKSKGSDGGAVMKTSLTTMLDEWSCAESTLKAKDVNKKKRSTESPNETAKEVSKPLPTTSITTSTMSTTPPRPAAAAATAVGDAQKGAVQARKEGNTSTSTTPQRSAATSVASQHELMPMKTPTAMPPTQPSAGGAPSASQHPTPIDTKTTAPTPPKQSPVSTTTAKPDFRMIDNMCVCRYLQTDGRRCRSVGFPLHRAAIHFAVFHVPSIHRYLCALCSTSMSCSTSAMHMHFNRRHADEFLDNGYYKRIYEQIVRQKLRSEHSDRSEEDIEKEVAQIWRSGDIPEEFLAWSQRVKLEDGEADASGGGGGASGANDETQELGDDEVTMVVTKEDEEREEDGEVCVDYDPLSSASGADADEDDDDDDLVCFPPRGALEYGSRLNTSGSVFRKDEEGSGREGKRKRSADQEEGKRDDEEEASEWPVDRSDDDVSSLENEDDATYRPSRTVHQEVPPAKRRRVVSSSPEQEPVPDAGAPADHDQMQQQKKHCRRRPEDTTEYQWRFERATSVTGEPMLKCLMDDPLLPGVPCRGRPMHVASRGSIAQHFADFHQRSVFRTQCAVCSRKICYPRDMEKHLNKHHSNIFHKPDRKQLRWWYDKYEQCVSEKMKKDGKDDTEIRAELVRLWQPESPPPMESIEKYIEQQ